MNELQRENREHRPMSHRWNFPFHRWISQIHRWIPKIHRWIPKIHRWISKIHRWIYAFKWFFHVFSGSIGCFRNFKKATRSPTQDASFARSAIFLGPTPSEILSTPIYRLLRVDIRPFLLLIRVQLAILTLSCHQSFSPRTISPRVTGWFQFRRGGKILIFQLPPYWEKWCFKGVYVVCGRPGIVLVLWHFSLRSIPAEFCSDTSPGGGVNIPSHNFGPIGRGMVPFCSADHSECF